MAILPVGALEAISGLLQHPARGQVAGQDDADEPREAEISREESKYERWYASLTLAQQIRVETRSALRRIMENRRRLRDPTLCTIEYVVGLWKGSIRRNQLRLVKIRIWRSTGVYPGDA